MDTAITQAQFWRLRAERLLKLCDDAEAAFGPTLNRRARRALPIWRRAAADYLALAERLEQEG